MCNLYQEGESHVAALDFAIRSWRIVNKTFRNMQIENLVFHECVADVFAYFPEGNKPPGDA
jgi:hypothetical protein